MTATKGPKGSFFLIQIRQTLLSRIIIYLNLYLKIK